MRLNSDLSTNLSENRISPSRSVFIKKKRRETEAAFHMILIELLGKSGQKPDAMFSNSLLVFWYPAALFMQDE